MLMNSTFGVSLACFYHYTFFNTLPLSKCDCDSYTTYTHTKCSNEPIIQTFSALSTTTVLLESHISTLVWPDNVRVTNFLAPGDPINQVLYIVIKESMNSTT